MGVSLRGDDMSEWISVEHQLSEPDVDVLVINERGGFKRSVISAGLFEGFGDIHMNGKKDYGWASWETEEEVQGSVTHWRPMLDLVY